MGRYEDELRGIVTTEPWAIPELANLRAALESLVRAVPIALQPEGFTGKAAESAKHMAETVSSQFGRIANLLAETDRIIDAANRASDRAAAQLGELPSAKVDQFWVNAATVASVVTFRGLDLPAKGAIQFIESAMAQEREEKAQQALEDLQMSRHQQEIRTARVRLREAAPEVGPIEEPIDGPVDPAAGGTDNPSWPGRSTYNPGSGGASGGTVVLDPGHSVGGGGNGGGGNVAGGTGGGTGGPGGGGPSVDGGTGGYFPGGGTGGGGGFGPGTGGGFGPGGQGGGLLPGVVGGGAGAAVLGVGSKIATSGFAGMGGGGVTPGGMGVGGSGFGGAGHPGGTGAGARIGGGGLLGAQGAAGGTSGASGAGAGSAAAGGRGGVGMMGGGAGGAAEDKEKRSGLGGLIAPKLEDEQDAAPRSARAGAGGRVKRPDATA